MKLINIHLTLKGVFLLVSQEYENGIWKVKRKIVIVTSFLQ